MANYKAKDFLLPKDYCIKYKAIINKAMSDYRAGIWSEYWNHREQKAYERGRMIAVICSDVNSIYHGRGLKKKSLDKILRATADRHII